LPVGGGLRPRRGCVLVGFRSTPYNGGGFRPRGLRGLPDTVSGVLRSTSERCRAEVGLLKARGPNILNSIFSKLACTKGTARMKFEASKRVDFAARN